MLLTVLANTLVIAIVVMIHYEFLYRISLYIPNMKLKHRFRVLFVVFSALIAHVLEIWCFAAAYYLMHHTNGWGTLEGNFNGSLLDCAYFSFTTFTTLGFGDIQPIGQLRYLTGLESLTGLVLITWTASFLYYEMQRYWDSQ